MHKQVMGKTIQMDGGSRRKGLRLLGAAIACFWAVVSASGQAAAPAAAPAAQQKPLMAEDVFKNVQLLRGIPVKEFMNTMGFFSAATGMNCVDCHDPQAESLAGYALDTPLKQTARRMIVMVNMLNQSSFAGQRKVTCYTCHRATDHPEAVPSLLDQYSVPEDDPDKVEIVTGLGKSPNAISADQVLDKYIRALGGAPALAKITSLVAKGTYEGYDSYSDKVPFEIFANSPNQLTTIIHTQHGDSVSTYDGKNGWVAASDKLLRVLPLIGGDLEGARMDAAINFPERLKQDFQWRTGFPSVSLDDRPVQIIQHGDAGAKLYFDNQTGLLTRQVRYVDTAVGVIPTQVDYSDYRPVNGVKMPFHIVMTWTDGRSTIELSQIQPNVRIDPSRFATPAPPTGKPATPQPAR